MLNGKFYTGLPPAMIERNSTQHNRMQSSIFWPDDTKVDSALETRVKRRNSLQIAQAERPLLRMQSSVSGVGGEVDVNTRQLFQKEFSKSSIEFLDNLGDETKVRKPLLFRGGRSGGNEVTPKPTAMKLPLPENVVNAGYTTAKKKQAFTSKIEFYDYVGDELNNRNNMRRAKMDMNDKKEMERNTKNSPKLQVKNNVHNFSTNEKLYPAERRGETDLQQAEHKATTDTKLNNNRRTQLSERAHEGYDDAPGIDEEYEVARRSLTGNKMSSNARGSHLRDLDFLESRRTVSPEYGYRRERRYHELYEDDYEAPDYSPSARYGRIATVRRANSVGRFTAPPKRILKNSIRERRYYDDNARDDYRLREAGRGNERYGQQRANDLHERNPEADDDIDCMEGCMRDMDLHRATTKKHVTYSDDTYSHDDEKPTQSRRPPPSSAQSRNRAPPPTMRTSAPNMRTGSNNQKRQQQQQQLQQELSRYNSEMDILDDDVNESFVEHKFMENDMYDDATTTTATTTKPLNNRSHTVGDEERHRLVNKINNNNNNKHNNYNNHAATMSRLNNQTISSAARKITPKMPTTKQNADTPTPTQDAEAAAAAAAGTDVKKHLRSSLCLHNGEIIASDDGGATSAKAAPTRNARTIATRQRISVGLPD